KRLAFGLSVWKRLAHKHVLKLLRTVSNFGPYNSIVCPWLEQGSVSKYMERHGDILSMTDRLQMLCEVTDGLKYRQSFSLNSIVHGDLTGSNILIDDEGKAKLCNFGLSSIVVEFSSSLATLTSCIGGAVRWADASLYTLRTEDDEAPVLTLRSDIYSFGSVTLEILSGRRPYFYIETDAQVVIEIHKGKKPRRPAQSFVTDAQWAFIQHCWAANPKERPDSGEVGRAMKALHSGSLGVPPAHILGLGTTSILSVFGFGRVRACVTGMPQGLAFRIAFTQELYTHYSYCQYRRREMKISVLGSFDRLQRIVSTSLSSARIDL
ncbi:kinase-like domain-containing protein, partial [Mycena haematopus]